MGTPAQVAEGARTGNLEEAFLAYSSSGDPAADASPAGNGGHA